MANLKLGKCLVISFLLTGCATTANYEKLLSSWVGSPESALISSWKDPYEALHSG